MGAVGGGVRWRASGTRRCGWRLLVFSAVIFFEGRRVFSVLWIHDGCACPSRRRDGPYLAAPARHLTLEAERRERAAAAAAGVA